MTSKLDQYLWIAVVGCIFGFVYCFAIGANDVANAFATSVASKSITLKQAVMIASVFEFCGVFFLGASVASTVQGKIFDINVYEDEPEIVMLGMLTSLLSGSLMVLCATHFGLPVSANQTIIGCIIGFSIAANGFSSVNWNATKNIFISWVVAPLLTGTIGFCVFSAIQRFILLSPEPFQRGYYTFSFILFATIGINVFFILSKGTKNFTHFHDDVYDIKWVLPASFGIGAVCGFLWVWPVGPRIKNRIETKRAARAAAEQTEGAKTSSPGALESTKGRRQMIVESIRSIASIGSILTNTPVYPVPSIHTTSSVGRTHPAALSFHSAVSSRGLSSSVRCRHKRAGSHTAEYNPEEGVIQFSIAESVKSLKLTIDSEVEEQPMDDNTEHTANITNEKPRAKENNTQKNNFFVRLKEKLMVKRAARQEGTTITKQKSMTPARTLAAAAHHDASSAPHCFQFIGDSINLSENIHLASSIRSTGSMGSSIGSHKERRGSVRGEYNPDEGAIKFAVDPSVKSVKLTIESEGAVGDEVERKQEEGEETNIDETHRWGVKEEKKKNFLIRFEEATYKQDLQEQCFLDTTTQQCWQNAAQYDVDAEQLFSYIQVFTASLSSFAHGANDIANAIAPVASIINIYLTGQLNPEAPVKKWVLVYGGVAVSVGLLLYGYNVMKTIGYKLTALSPSRGASAALSSSLTVATAAYIGMPVSTTQCILGAVAGIGLVEGRHNVQWAQIGKCVIGWILIFVAAAVLSAMVFAFAAYSPSLTI